MTLTDEQIQKAVEVYEYGCGFYLGTPEVSKTAMREAIEAALSLQGEAVPVAILTAPKKIWLNIGDIDLEEAETNNWTWNQLSEVTWCEDKIDQCDIPYIRADLAFASPPLTTFQQSELIRKCAEICEKIEDNFHKHEGMKYPELKTDAQTGARICAEAILALLPEEGKG